MLVLSMDTSSKTVCVGLIKDNENLCNFTLSGTKFHSESLIDMIEEVLNQQNLRINDVDLFVVGNGPGSFTGLRIALTVAKTFAQTLNKPVVAVSSLEAYAYHFKGRKKVIPIIDARRSRAFYGIYNTESEIDIIKEDSLSSFEEIKTFVDEDTILVGESAESLKEELGAKYGYQSEILPTDLARLGLIKFEKNGTDNFFELVPNYLNVSQAERQWQQK